MPDHSRVANRSQKIPRPKKNADKKAGYAASNQYDPKRLPYEVVTGIETDVNTIALPQIREHKSRAPKFLFRFGDARPVLISILVGFAYYVGAKMGFALKFPPHPVSVMWLPNSILLAAFLLMPVRKWWLLIATAFPAHIAVELGSGVPWAMVLCWFISNCFEAVFGAAAVRAFSKDPVRFDSFRNISIFFFWGALIAPLLSSFLDSGFVMLNRWGNQGYWEVWRVRLFSNICTSIILVPAIVAWCTGGPISLRNISVARFFETLLLGIGFLITSVTVFSWLEAGAEIPALLYAPLPFLLWATLRCSLRGTTTAIFIVAVLAIWGATHGRGPFPTRSPEFNAFSVQAFLVGTGITLNLFATSLLERKAMVAALKSNEARYREVVESQTELVCRHLPDTTLTFVNHAYCQMFRRSREELIGRKFLELMPQSAHEGVLLEIASLVTNGQSITTEHEILLADGGVGWLHWVAHAIKDSNGHVREIQAIGRDIGERKKMEMALRDSEERNRAILDAFPDLMFLMSESGVYLDYYANDEKQLLVPPPLLLNRNVQEILPPKLAQEIISCLQAVARTDEMKVLEYELVIGGQPRSYEARLVRCGAGKILSLIRDITERKQAQEALRESEERYREVVESQTELVLRFSPDAIITFVNKAGCDFYGKKREELIGRKLFELVPSELHAKIASDIAGIISDKQPVICEIPLPRADGTSGWYHWTKYGITDADGRVTEIQAIGNDVTDRKRAEEAGEKLVHASRLAVVGELTAMIAHEVNQPLTAILNNAEAAETLFALGSVPFGEIRSIIADIHSDGLRATKAIGRVRDLVQKRKMQVHTLDINALIKEVVKIVGPDATRRHVQIRTQFSPALPVMLGDPVRLQQVLLNLILNGMDAMNDVENQSRILTLQTEKGTNGHVVVTVKDSGHGLSVDALPRIFESFYSTKADGMGLGLSVARSIVEEHRGRIWAERNSDGGAAIHFALPSGDWRKGYST
jgi:PAS domain S-box-containing protein